MIKPKNNVLIYAFFSTYISYIIKRHFKYFLFNKIAVNPNSSILLIANHYSWWDGFVFFHLNKLLFKKKFFVMVKEETAKNVKFLKYLGAFSVLQNSRSMLESIKYAAELLENPNHLVLIFPQGNLQSMHTNELNFQNGVLKIINQIKGNWQAVFGIALLDYFEHAKPSLNIYLSPYNHQNNINLAEQFQTYYNDCKLKQGAKSV